MTHFDLLEAVQPADGWYAVVGIKGKDDVRQNLVATREELDQLAHRYVSQQRNVFFGVAKYETDESRRKENVKALKAFWLDIDCGPSKAEVNAKTGRPDGYIDQATGLQELRKFCQLIGLPKPILVNSGRGLHAYWPLEEEITREQWEPVAERLFELTVIHELYVDSSVFEVARILRVPGTYNFKEEPPLPVTVISEAGPTPFDAFVSIVGAKEKKERPTREMSELAKSMMGNTVSKFSKIMQRSGKGDGCQQLLDCYENQNGLAEPRWFDALSIAKFCEDRNTAIHRLSDQHDDYDHDETEAKTRHILGPHTCDEFERHNPGGCDGCPHQGKIKSPIVLGKVVVEATAEDNMIVTEDEEGEEEIHNIPPYPSPFFRGKQGGIYWMPAEDEAEPVRVYENDLYVVKRMRDPNLGEVVLMKLHLPRDGVQEFVVPNTHIMDKTELRKELSSHGVLCGQKQFALLIDYIILAVKELQYKKKAEQMRQQFGWADNGSKFIIGDREITSQGTFHSPPSQITSNLAELMVPKGSLEKWKEVASLYGLPGHEPHAFAMLTAFGSPLLRFLGQNGAIINVIFPDSGTGKSTILYMANSVYGDPERLCAVKADTMNAKILRLGVMNNLPFTVDEITNMEPKEFSELAYNMSQGRGKDRVKSSSNELRKNFTSWQSISLCSSNASFYEKLASLKSSPDGEMMRLIEYVVDYAHVVETGKAKQMFDHQLKENYGHAGDIYAQWLVNNMEEARNTALTVQSKIDRELKLTQRERFWSAVVAANITGGLIARNIGLIDWNMQRIYKFATSKILSLREDVKPPAQDAVATIGDYINRHMQNILVVQDAVDMRTQKPMMPQLEPRGELLIRYEPDTKKMYVAAKPFKNDCVRFQVNYKETLKDLEGKGIYVGTMNKRLSKGMKVTSPGVHILIFDCSGEEFLNIEDMVLPEEQQDGGGEG